MGFLWAIYMNANEYFNKTKKRPLKTKPRTRPLPKAKEVYLEAEEKFEHSLNIFGIKYEKKFQFKSTKHWRFDFHLIEHRILVESYGRPWLGGRGGKLKTRLGVWIVTMLLQRWDLPKHYLAGHDVEEFFGVVKRWGANDNVKRLVEVATNAPFVSDFNVSACCGNCVIG